MNAASNKHSRWAERAVMSLGMAGGGAFGVTLGWVFVWWAAIVTLFALGMALIHSEPEQRETQ